MTLTLGGLTALLYEQLSYFEISSLGVVARSDARPPGMRPVADSILTSSTHSRKEKGHEENIYDHYLPSADSRKGSCQLLAKEYALTILVNCLGGLPGNSVDRLTDRARNDHKSVEEPKNTNPTTKYF